MKWIIFILINLFSVSIFSQAMPCSFLNLDLNREIYSTKTIYVTLHILQNSKGEGNFSNKEAEKAHLEKLINSLNAIYSRPEFPSNKDSVSMAKSFTHFRNAKLKIEILDTLYHKISDELFDYRKQVGYYNGEKKDTIQDHNKALEYGQDLYRMFVANYIGLNGVKKSNTIHIFMAEGRKMAGRGIACGILCNKWLLLVGSYSQYLEHNYESMALIMGHELGHNFGLYHLFEFKTVEDLSLQLKGTTNNLMDVWPNQGRALSNRQMQNIWQNLEGKEFQSICLNKTNLKADFQKKAVDDYVIKGRDTLKINPSFCNDKNILIKYKGVLYVHCDLKMMPNTYIKIEEGGKLFIDNASIGPCDGDSSWDGIKMKQSKKWMLFLKNPKRAKIEFRNNGYFFGTENGIQKF